MARTRGAMNRVAKQQRRNTNVKAEFLCESTVITNKACLLWKIKNFSFCYKRSGEYIESFPFSTDGDENTKWRARLYPNGQTQDVEALSVVMLFNTKSSRRTVIGKLQFFIVDNDNEKVCKHSDEECQIFKDDAEYGLSNFISRDELLRGDNNFLPEDTLTLYFEVETLAGTIHEMVKTVPIPIKEPECRVMDDLGNVLQSREFSDITIVVDTVTFKAHKLILAARSPVFATMFKHWIHENSMNKVEVTDAKPNVFQQMLCFIYTGKLENEDDLGTKTMLDLLVVANKYELKDLKEKCESLLSAVMTVEEAADILVFANLSQAERLKEKVIDFIYARAEEVKITAGWENLKMHHKDLIESFIISQLL